MTTANELRTLGEEDLASRLSEVKEEFFNLRFQNGTGQLENYKRIALVKKDIARIETIMKEREAGIDVPLKEVLPKKERKREKKQEPEASESSAPEEVNEVVQEEAPSAEDDEAKE